jgi:hypothetical protein
VRCHINYNQLNVSYPTINYCPKINNNNINNFIIAGANDEEPQQFSQLSGLSYVKNGKPMNNNAARSSFKGDEAMGGSAPQASKKDDGMKKANQIEDRQVKKAKHHHPTSMPKDHATMLTGMSPAAN